MSARLSGPRPQQSRRSVVALSSGLKGLLWATRKAVNRRRKGDGETTHGEVGNGAVLAPDSAAEGPPLAARSGSSTSRGLAAALTSVDGFDGLDGLEGPQGASAGGGAAHGGPEVGGDYRCAGSIQGGRSPFAGCGLAVILTPQSTAKHRTTRVLPDRAQPADAPPQPARRAANCPEPHRLARPVWRRPADRRAGRGAV